jgi:hypothetical protein
MNNRFRKYMVYAVGEIVLVVIGILIALQINNWNQKKIEENALNGYLTSISNNIRSDLKKIHLLREDRVDANSRIPHIFGVLSFTPYLDRRDIKFLSETLTAVSKISYLNKDDSGFESIKNSGYLSKLQGQDLENLIYTYYNLVKEIEVREQDYNQSIKDGLRDIASQQFEHMIYINVPDYIGAEAQLTALQPAFKEILFHPSVMTLYNQAYFQSPELVMHYDNLTIYGEEIIRMIENDLKSFDQESTLNLSAVFDPSSGEGYGKIITNGAVNLLFYEWGYASYESQPFATISERNEIVFQVPEMPWATAYYRNPSNVLEDRQTKDFSAYRALSLELKGNLEGQTVQVAIQDDTDPDDGTESRVPLTLTTDWERYEIPLSEFKTADLTRLFVVASFVFEKKAHNISVRNIEYLK